MKKSSIGFGLLLASLAIIEAAGQATVREYKRVMKTYDFTDPDPVPRPGKLYPYFRFDGYTNKAIDKAWNFVELKNEFIEVAITPEIGGKVWGAKENKTGFSFVYFNDVVKFRDIAMRGAWTSGGIEFNFGDIGHAPTVATPVDYHIRTNTDGSVSCFLGAWDWSARTRWQVEVNLPKDKAYFTTKSRWFNASETETSYYHWMNAGFKASGDLEFLFKGTHYLGHGGEAYPWPIDSLGRNLAYYDKNNFGSYKSYHVMGQPSDYYGGYWHQDKIGFVHFSPYSDNLGQKIWIWGLSDQGMIWEKLLTDQNGQYVELQSGRLFNQAAGQSMYTPFKHVGFAPGLTDQWTEYWYPIIQTPEVQGAYLWGAYSFQQKESGQMELCISPTVSINEKLVVKLAGKTLFEKSISAKPLQTTCETFQLPSDAKVYLGKDKLDFTEVDADESARRPVAAHTKFDWNTAYGHYLQAKGLANQRDYKSAEEALNKSLAIEPSFLPALSELAQLLYRKGRFQEAIQVANRALSINTYDGLANYIKGLSYRRLYSSTAAKEALSVAALDPTFRANAWIELAKLAIELDQLERASYLVKQILDFQPSNLHASHLRLFLARKSGRIEEHTALIQQLEAEDPLDHWVRAERYLASGSQVDAKRLVEGIQSELSQQNFLEMALWYASFQDYQSAELILALSPQYLLSDLWLVYFKEKMGVVTASSEQIKAILTKDAAFVTPFRLEDLVLVDWLKTKASTNEPTFRYLQALLYWQLGREEEAKEFFGAIEGALGRDFMYMAKAQLFADEPAIKRESIEKAYALNPTHWRNVKQLTEVYMTGKEYDKALTLLDNFRITSQTPDHEVYILGQVRARCLAELTRYQEAIDLLQTLNVLPSEGARGAHMLFRESCIKRAAQLIAQRNKKQAIKYLELAETWPENLGSGAPYDPDNRLTRGLIEHFSSKRPNEPVTLKNLAVAESDKPLLYLFFP